MAAPILIALASLLATAAFGAVVGSPSALWHFDEAAGLTALDAIGGLDGTLDAGVDRVAGGRSGGALRFNGESRVTVSDHALLRADQLSIGLWVRGDPQHPPVDGQVILEKGGKACGVGSYAFVVDGGHVALKYRESEPADAPVQTVTVDTIDALPSLWDGAWHLVGFTVSTGDDWGSISLYEQGWALGANLGSHRLAYGETDVSELAIGGAADAGCGTAGFTGDVDEVAVYSGVVPAESFGAQEDPVTTSMEILDVDPMAVDATAQVRVKLTSAPIGPGSIRAYVKGEDGIERLAGVTGIDWWALPVDGEFTISVHPVDGGVGTLRVAYEPSGEPFVGSQASAQITIAKAPAFPYINLPYTYIAGVPIDVGVVVSTGVQVNVNGSVELYEVTPQGSTLLAAKPVPSAQGSFNGGADFIIPSGSAGDRTFWARYLGGTAHLPADSAQVTITVHPALVPGELRINGGDAATDDPVVTLDTPAVGAVAMQVSRDVSSVVGLDPPTDWAPTTTTWLTDPSHGDNADGTRRIWVRYADAIGRWSEWLTDTIILDRGVPAGTVSINGGATVTASRSVTVSAPIADPAAVQDVELSNDGRAWSTYPYAASINWLLAGDGMQLVHVRWRDLEGRQSAPVTDSILVDTRAPVIGTIRPSVLLGGQPGGSVRVRLSWPVGETAGVRSQELAIRRDGGTWTPIPATAAARSVNVSLAQHHAYELRVRATDILGHRSAWRYSPPLRVDTVQEPSSRIAFHGTWRTASADAYWGGGSRFARARGASASLSFRGRAIAWVAPVGPTRGRADVVVDGVFAGTVDLWAPASANSRVVFERSWATAGTHTIKVVVRGTAGHPRVDVDGFVVLAPS